MYYCALFFFSVFVFVFFVDGSASPNYSVLIAHFAITSIRVQGRQAGRQAGA